MLVINPAYSTLYDTARQIIRSCKRHGSTDTFVLGKNSALVRTHVGKYTSMWLAAQSPEHKQYQHQQQCYWYMVLEYDGFGHFICRFDQIQYF